MDNTIRIMAICLYLLGTTFIFQKWINIHREKRKFWKTKYFKIDIIYLSFVFIMALFQLIQIK